MKYFYTFFKQLGSVQDEVSFDSSRLKAFQMKSQVGCFCMHATFFVVVRMKFETNAWLLPVVSWSP